MMNLPPKLSARIKSGDLRGLRVFAYLYRNKWNAVKEAFETESAPIDITPMLVKCGALSTNLNVGEINEYTASNMTLTLSDTKSRFVEQTPDSYFPDGYQIYGSRVSIFYGETAAQATPLFHGVIKDMPNHTPENYQLSLTLVSPLELLEGVEAKAYSDEYPGEALTLDHRESDNRPVYKTAHLGVGGFSAVYADGTKLYDGVDYEVSQVNERNKPALVEVINPAYNNAVLTADYYAWRRNKRAEDIITCLLLAAGWPEDKLAISPVAWQSDVRVGFSPAAVMTVGYKTEGDNYVYAGDNGFFEGVGGLKYGARVNNFPADFTIHYFLRQSRSYEYEYVYYQLGDLNQALPSARPVGDGIRIMAGRKNRHGHNSDAEVFEISVYQNGRRVAGQGFSRNRADNRYPDVTITKRGTHYDFAISGGWRWTWDGELNIPNNQINEAGWDTAGSYIYDYSLAVTDTNLVINGNGLLVNAQNNPVRLEAVPDNENVKYIAQYNDGNGWNMADLGRYLPITAEQAYFKIEPQTPVNTATTDFSNVTVFRLDKILVFDYVDLSGQNVLDVLKDLALVSGYEFGINRQNVFFFRPRTVSTTPVYVLDETELVKVDTVKRAFNDLATKLTLNFAEIPLEFYADTGLRPTPVDKYGVINKNIDKPQIINYDNPELAQAIGPQLLTLYSDLRNVIGCTGRWNLNLELGDVVNLKREMPLTVPEDWADYTKYERLNTFYRACKITGLNYDFAKRQIKYTLRDESNKNNAPEKEFYAYQTVFPTPLDYKE